MANAGIEGQDRVGEERPRLPMVDIHAHYMPREILDKLQRDGKAGAVSVARLPGDMKAAAPIADLDARADWLRERDIGWQLLGPEMRFARYDLPPLEGATWSRRVNEAMLESSHRYGIYAVIAMVPMQDGGAAARELEYAVRSLGCRGAMVHSQAPLGLHDARMDPFWAAASELDVPVLIHSGMPCADERVDVFKLSSAVGRPHEVTLAACQLIFGGVLDRFPSLDLVLLTAGGTLPYLMPKLDAISADGRYPINEPKPSAYFDRFYFDSLAYGPQQLRLLIALVGAYRVMIGTDWPIELHESDPLRLLRGQGLTTEMWRGILAATATKLFRVGDMKELRQP
jgi:aminocarboxymuconate-semialdehyde decarboxylase